MGVVSFTALLLFFTFITARVSFIDISPYKLIDTVVILIILALLGCVLQYIMVRLLLLLN